MVELLDDDLSWFMYCSTAKLLKLQHSEAMSLLMKANKRMNEGC